MASRPSLLPQVRMILAPAGLALLTPGPASAGRLLLLASLTALSLAAARPAAAQKVAGSISWPGTPVGSSEVKAYTEVPPAGNRVNTLTLGGPDQSAFTIVTDQFSGRSYDGSMRAEVDVRFSPAQARNYDAWIDISGDYFGTPFTIRINLTGTGTPAAPPPTSTTPPPTPPTTPPATPPPSACKLTLDVPATLKIAQGGLEDASIHYQTTGGCSWWVQASLAPNPQGITGSVDNPRALLPPASMGMIPATLTVPPNTPPGTYVVYVDFSFTRVEQGVKQARPPGSLQISVTVVPPAPPSNPPPAVPPAPNSAVSVQAVADGFPTGSRLADVLITVASSAGVGASLAPFDLPIERTAEDCPDAVATEVVLEAPEHELLDGSPLTFEGWRVGDDPMLVETSSTISLDAPYGAAEKVTPVYEAEPGPNSTVENTANVDGGQTKTTDWKDEKGNVIGSIVEQTVVNPDGSTTTTTGKYDKNGQTVSIDIDRTAVDANGNTTITHTSSKYNGSGQIQERTESTEVHKTAPSGESEVTTTIDSYVRTENGLERTGTIEIYDYNNPKSGKSGQTITRKNGKGEVTGKYVEERTDDGKGHTTDTITKTDGAGTVLETDMVDKTTDASGASKSTRTHTGIDSRSGQPVTTVTETTDDGKGNSDTTVTSRLGPCASDAFDSKITIVRRSTKGHRTTVTTSYGGSLLQRGPGGAPRYKGMVVVDEVDKADGTTTRTTTVYDEAGNVTSKFVVSFPTPKQP